MIGAIIGLILMIAFMGVVWCCVQMLLLLIAFMGVVWYCVQMLLPLIPMAEPFRTILRVLVILLVAAAIILRSRKVGIATSVKVALSSGGGTLQRLAAAHRTGDRNGMEWTRSGIRDYFD